MTEKTFKWAVKVLLDQRANDKLHALDLGREFRDLCEKYLKDHDSLPKGFEAFE